MTPNDPLRGSIRQSNLSAFDQCALSAFFESEIASENWSTHPQSRGTLTHRVLGKCLREMARQHEGTMPVDAALAILHETLRQHDVPAADVVNVPMQEVKDLYWIVKKWAHETSWSTDNLVAVEERLFAPVVYYSADGELVQRTVSGQLDALLVEGTDHAIVLDWKDTWMLPAATEISFGGYFQQRFYAFLVMIAYPTIQKVTLREFYVRYSEAREATIWRDELDDVRAEITALVERYDRAFRESAFPPSPGKHCSYCLRPQDCPIPKRLRREGQIESDAEAAIVARQLIVGQSVARQAKLALAAWADRHGSIPIADAKGRRALGFIETERTSRPSREQLEQALAAGEVDIDRLYRTTVSTRFQEFVPNPEADAKADADLLAALEASLAEARARKAG